jgi:glycosyltransferase involved in cell wall biosynthesis
MIIVAQTRHINKRLQQGPTRPRRKTKLLWVGRFTDIKDPLYAISVIKYLEKISPDCFELLMIGGGELLEASKVASQNLPINFTGWSDKPFQSAGSFDLLLLTSINEGMGLVMLEAANYSKATVARNVGGIGEFLINNKNGYLVSGDFKEMANKINIISTSEINSLGSAAKTILDKDFSDIRLAKDYFDLYRSLII